MCHRETLQCGIWASNDRGGADILVTSATAFPVPGIYGRPVDRIAVGAPPDAAQDQYGSKMGDPPPPLNSNPKIIVYHSCGKRDLWNVWWRVARDGQ